MLLTKKKENKIVDVQDWRQTKKKKKTIQNTESSLTLIMFVGNAVEQKIGK